MNAPELNNEASVSIDHIPSPITETENDNFEELTNKILSKDEEEIDTDKLFFDDNIALRYELQIDNNDQNRKCSGISL